MVAEISSKFPIKRPVNVQKQRHPPLYFAARSLILNRVNRIVLGKARAIVRWLYSQSSEIMNTSNFAT